MILPHDQVREISDRFLRPRELPFFNGFVPLPFRLVTVTPSVMETPPNGSPDLILTERCSLPMKNGPLGLPSLHFGPPHNHGSPGPRGSFRSTHRSKKVRMAPPAVCARLRAPSGWHDDHRATCRGSRLNARKSPPPPAKPTYPFPSRKPAKKSNTPSPAQGMGTALGGCRDRQIITRHMHQDHLPVMQNRLVGPGMMPPERRPDVAPQFHTLVIETLDRAPYADENHPLSIGHRRSRRVVAEQTGQIGLTGPSDLPTPKFLSRVRIKTHCQNGGTRLRILRNLFVGRHEHPPPAHHWRTLPRTRKLDPPTDRLVFGYTEGTWRVPRADKVSIRARRLGPLTRQDKTHREKHNKIRLMTFDHKPIITEKQTTKLIDGQTGQKKTSLLN